MDKNNITNNDMHKLYIFIVQSKDLNYEEFSKSLYRRTKMNVKEVLNLIFENRDKYEEKKIYQMKLIISYIINKKLNKVTKQLQNEVDKIKLKDIKQEKTCIAYPGYVANKQLLEMRRDESLNTTRKMLNDIFKKNFIDKENALKLSHLVSINLKNLTDDEYLNYLKIRYSIDPISIEDLDLIEGIVLDEINNITNKIAMLDYYNSTNDLEGIKSIEISKQVYKSQEYQTSLGNVAYSKTKRLEHLQKVLINLYERIIKIKETKNCSDFEKMSQKDISYLKANYPSICDVYKQIDNTTRVYKSCVEDIHNVVDSRKKSISKEYNKRFLLINKEAQE